MISADDAVVLDLPWLAQVVPAGRAVAGGTDPVRTADVLSLDLASEVVRHLPGPAVGGARAAIHRLRDIPFAARCLEFFGLAALAETAVSVDPELTVADGSMTAVGHGVRVSWWRDGGQGWVDGSPSGIGRMVAYLADRWADRLAFVAIAAGERGEPGESALSSGTADIRAVDPSRFVGTSER